ncbi:MAG: bifunctional metallophosphatase/5'-nucleotidase, partial [Clostridia bacterium]|nr:bifunctional metallophosphatase/5'-nucleotidase [Clostridia bacterium]
TGTSSSLQNGCTHKDTDDDGTCDNCRISVVVILDLYALNDLHGKFDDTGDQPGVDELTTFLKTAVKTNPQTVLLSSGDMWQGSPESNMTAGRIITDWMNHLNFAAMTLGNHEYDWGEDPVETNAKAANFPMLAINVYDNDTGKRVDYADASVMIERGGAKIGIIGAIGDCYSSIAPDKVEGIHFKVGSDLTALVKAEATRLRQQGADIIVYSLHDGYGSSGNGSITNGKLASFYDASLSDGYVDLVFEGHTHQRYVLQDSHGVYHLQNGGENKGISHAKVAVNVANDSTDVQAAEFIASGAYTHMADDPVVDRLLDQYADDIEDANRMLGYNSRYRSSRALMQLVADRYYEAGMERWGDKYKIALGGGFLTVRSPYDLDPGEVTYGMLQMLLPFDNDLVLCSVQGRYLSSKFFFTDNDRYAISYGDYGASIKDSIDPNATYYVVVDTYTSSYKPNHLTVVDTYTPGVYARDLLADFVSDGGLE